VLLVEDDVPVRDLTMTLLRERGYKILEAGNGLEALLVAQEASDEIHPLFTDVILPDMNGRELSELLRIARPSLKVLFTSGYSDDIIAPRGILDPGVAYLSKPFRQDALLAKIREVLSEGAGSSAGPVG
jgi:two-component system cell cycle sensor histidine kinase/response regulator CckA